uniref:Jasmonic acid-amino acid-conjugating enzyme n=1 Tax=Solanum tuberosum TaxID=4113 RepID=M1AL81_SOLTU
MKTRHRLGKHRPNYRWESLRELREFPIENGKALNFIYSSKQFKTKGGLAAGTATTNLYHNAHFKKTMKAMQTP